ncbi:hypothetical protein [Hyalangium versicolor]|uniref:hypothetical protein n=1 Tax=Hyalangium versicolor TaxID=2861190 RepID=UPI001CCA6B7E|nr:hypothetical protein [Hyalangium versicolor]
MPSLLDLTTVAKAANRLDVGAEEGELPDLVTAASEALADWLGYPLHRREGVVETCAGGAQRLFLRSGAVQAVASVSVFGQQRPTNTYRLEDGVKGILLSLREPWPFTGRTGGGVSQSPLQREDTGEIAVTFSAGWVTPGQVELESTRVRDLPQVLEQAALLTVTAWYRRKGDDPDEVSVSLGDASTSYGSGRAAALPTSARALVARYRKHGRGTP